MTSTELLDSLKTYERLVLHVSPIEKYYIYAPDESGKYLTYVGETHFYTKPLGLFLSKEEAAEVIEKYGLDNWKVERAYCPNCREEFTPKTVRRIHPKASKTRYVCGTCYRRIEVALATGKWPKW